MGLISKMNAPMRYLCATRRSARSRILFIAAMAPVLGAAAPANPPPHATPDWLSSIADSVLFIAIMDSLRSLFSSALAWLSSPTGSAVIIAIISTFVSAFAGTWGAQVIAERVAKKKELRREMHGVNVAIGFAFNIANTYIATKKQHIQEIVNDYEKQSEDRQAHQADVSVGRLPPTAAFRYRLELRTILPPFSPIDGLQRILLDKITPDGRASILLTPLIQSIQGFADTVSQRNAWIAEFKALPDGNDAHKAAIYFGTPYAPGRIDDRYPNFMRTLAMQTDDCIAFGILMTESLIAYGQRLAARYGRGAPKLAKPDFGKAAHLLPDMKHYADWVNG